ncbi:nucleoside ABC transporter membrane protein [Natranaerovirga hydrolytica]|uniref:Nucleoside ABC transporter membrane protein n=1 Tax=Natranaerovirga hydrolytica TaxID=680378 RepID=A0A4R1N4A6_9FIRM|nr:ABC transporter permease [Natranaerovirga hydrolytica]TCK97759.1 nucleoside ABC transporter membrane protein [Natranaerovirga hydrolytica]
MINFLTAAVVAMTPLLFATLGEMIMEKVGNLNLGVEGMMLMGAVVGFYAGFNTGNPLLALLSASGAGALGALIYAVLTVTLRANQVVSGLALTIFGTGFANFVGRQLVGKTIPRSISTFFSKRAIPFVSEIPIVGPVFFNQDLFVYLGYFVVVCIGLYLYKTRKGLNMRMVGESPAAADAIGIPVNLYKYIHILIGGMLCGLGGAYLSLVYVPAWQESIIAGRGWIAIALVIFSQWNPYKAFLGAYLFGALQIAGFRLQGTSIPISQYFTSLLPYMVTIIVLIIGSVKENKKNNAPEGLTIPYFREER